MASIGSKERATNVDRHVGARMRVRRTEMGMNQDDVARALKLSYQQVQKYETGANRISAGEAGGIERHNGGVMTQISAAGVPINRQTAHGTFRPFGQDMGTADDESTVVVDSSDFIGQ